MAKIAAPKINSRFAEISFMADTSVLIQRDQHSIIRGCCGWATRVRNARYGENGGEDGQSTGGWPGRESGASRSGAKRVGFPRPVTAQVAKTRMAISIGGMKRIA